MRSLTEITRPLALLYCAPERLGSLVRQLSRAGREVSLLAVDEAHCIVEWGNEFRPVYRRLDRYRYLLGDPVTIALTGSATPETRAEILRVELRRPDGTVIVGDRPDLGGLAGLVSEDFRTAAEDGTISAGIASVGESEAVGPGLSTSSVLREYFPLQANGRVQAVVGVWRDATPILAELDRLRRDVVVTTLVAALVDPLLKALERLHVRQRIPSVLGVVRGMRSATESTI